MAQSDDRNAMLTEALLDLQRHIAKTRSEIGFLRPRQTVEHEPLTMAEELDAVIHAIETATMAIIGGAEDIDRQMASDPDCGSETRAAVQQQTMAIFEACGFQDLTGQRLAKVIATLKVVENRLDTMVEICGGQMGGNTDDANPISQAEIDKIFD